MCRITAIKGPLHADLRLIAMIDELQENGGTIKQEVFSGNDFVLALNRFDVTTSRFKSGAFPLEDKRYVLGYNGEVYSFRNETFNKSGEISDAHFALRLIWDHGHEVFFREADFEGTFMLYDKVEKSLFVYVDQLNTKGCFFASINGNTFVTQELYILHRLLEYARSQKDEPVYSLKRGERLCISSNHALKVVEYKPDFKDIWSGKEGGAQAKRINKLYTALKKAVSDRIPAAGPFGILCGGGIDSSLILKIAIDVLAKRKQLDRLKVFTLGTPENPLHGEDNDWDNINYLLNYLGLNDSGFFQIVYPCTEWNKYLLAKEILSDSPRLITPNPVQTQVRHTMAMSVVLAQIAMTAPEIKIVITGDFADEIFAGYNSMHSGCLEELKSRVQEKLDDLHLNDAARVTLASLRGCKYIIKNWIDGQLKTSFNPKQNISQHPVEVRTPFASPIVASILKEFPGSDLVGVELKKVQSKYILRRVAEKAGLPPAIAWRKKIPFNEGGTGIRNAEPYRLEEILAATYLKENRELIESTDVSFLSKLGIRDQHMIGKKNDYEYALYMSSMQTGLKQLLQGNTFREIMPDSNYSSTGNLDVMYKFLF